MVHETLKESLHMFCAAEILSGEVIAEMTDDWTAAVMTSWVGSFHY